MSIVKNSLRDLSTKKAYRNFKGDQVFLVSVGLKDAEDLCADLAQALEVKSGNAKSPLTPLYKEENLKSF